MNWTETAGGTYSWNVNANPPWNTGSFPNAQDAVANLNLEITGNQTINLNQAITTGSITLGDTGGTETMAIAPNGGSLTFDVSAGNASLTKAASTSTTVIDTISAPVILNDNLDITNNSALFFPSPGNPQGLLRISGGISDGGAGNGITKLGPGTVSLTGGAANTYTGPTIVNEGTLLVQAAHSIPDASPISVIATGTGATAVLRWGLFNGGVPDTIGPVTLGGTTTTSLAVVNMGFNQTLILGGDVTYDATNDPLGAHLGWTGPGGSMSVGTISLGGATRTFNVGDSASAGNDLSFNQFVTNGSIIKDGLGTLAFNTGNGLTNVWVKRGAAFSAQPGGMSASVLMGDSSGSDNVFVHMLRGGSTNVVVSGGNTGTATLQVTHGVGSGSAALSGTIQLGDVNGAHDLTILGTTAFNGQPTYTGNISGNGDLTITGVGSTANPDLRFLMSSINHSGSIDVTGTGEILITAVIGPNVTGVNKSGSSLLTLGGINTYTGDTNVTGGTLQLNNVDALQNSTLNTGPSGSQQVTFNVAGTNTYNLGGLQGTDDLVIGANSISVGANGANTAYNGAISGSGGGLTKVGGGTLTLSGNSNYTGSTNVDEGTLQVDGTLATGGGNVNVAASGTLGGNGAINRVVQINDGVLSPGASVGQISIGGNLSGSGAYFWELGALLDDDTGTAGSDWDLVSMSSGNADASSLAIELNFDLLASGLDPDGGDSFWDADHSWLVLELASGATNSGATSFNNIVNGTFDAGTFSTEVDEGDQIYLVFTPTAINLVAEPSTFSQLCMIGLLALGGLAYRRKLVTRVSKE